MAECTPNFRAAYDAADTTPRSSRCPPTTTALPLSDGSNNSSTETKNASISTWKMVRAKAGNWDVTAMSGLYQPVVYPRPYGRESQISVMACLKRSYD